MRGPTVRASFDRVIAAMLSRARAGQPRASVAVAGEMEVAAARDRIGRGRRRVAVFDPHHRHRPASASSGSGDGLQGVRIPARQSGVVEQAEGEFGIGRHGGLLVVAGLRAAARARPPGSGRAGRLWVDRKGTGGAVAYAATGIGSGASAASPSSASGTLSGGPAWLVA